MDVLIWIVVGVVAAFVTRMIIPGEALGGVIGDLTMGLIGACFAGFLVQSYHLGHAMPGYLWWTTAACLAGAAGFLMVLRAYTSWKIV